MIEFHAPTPADKAWVDELLARGNYRGCDYNFTNLYVWSRAYNQRIARVDDFLVTHVCGRLGCSYMYPAGSGDIAAVIRALEADAAEKGEPLRLVCLTPRQMAELEEFFPGRFAYTADREHYEELGLEGGLIRVYGEVVAFTIGDRLSADTYDVHFEKAYGELQGAYAMINREFARWVRARHPEIRYLNREDDMGVEGLRKAKQSYYPDLMVEKHTAVMK